ncbi:MAG TPA: M28 family peptidase [Candidatus Obscuribacterales bacterium]
MELKARLRHHLTQIARDRDPYLATAGHFFVQQYIRQQLEQWGQVAIQNFQVQGMSLQNLILDLPATPRRSERSLPPILLGAHYDSVPGSPGADDNATGVAVLLELARSFHQAPAHYPLRLVAFDFEETSYNLAGSTHYATSLQQEPLRLMLALEMLGYCDRTPGSQKYPPGLKYFFPNQGNFIGLIGNLKTIPDLIHLSHHLRRAGVPCRWLPAGQRGMVLPDTRRSDHAAFWDRGDRALMVTDTANLRNPHYHKPSDQIETLDLDFLTKVCQGLEQGIRHL